MSSGNMHRTGVYRKIKGMIYCWECHYFEHRCSDVCLHPSNREYSAHSNYKTNYCDAHFISYPPELNKGNDCKNFKPISFIRKIGVRLFDLHA